MNPAQVHLLLNHLSLLGTLFAAALTAAALARGSDELKKAGLWAFVVAALFVVPTYLTGEPAEEVVEHLPGVLESLIHDHEEAAEKALAGTLALGAAALGGLLHALKTRALHRAAAPLALALALPVLALLGWTAHLGGLIMHPELRGGPSAMRPGEPAPAEKH